jgi:CheY-like chemotaxis protein
MTTDSASEVPTVLLVDDERDIRDLARLILEKSGLRVSEAVDGTQALAQFAELNPPPTPSVVVLDNRMPGLTGIEVAERMLSIYPDQVILLFSAFLDQETEAAATAVGVKTCVSKTEVRRLPEIIRSLIAAA